MVRIRITKLTHEILSVISSFDVLFSRPLSSRISNIEDYAEKLSKNSYFILAEDDSIIAGFAAMYANDSVTRQAYLSLIAVLHKYRGKEVGQLLLRSCEINAKENGMKTMKLEVDKNNIYAIRFYERNGFFGEEENNLSMFMVKTL